MSKLITKYKKLKNKNQDTIYLFKSGIFYIFLDEDAKKMSPILNLKLTNLNAEILKCGFPENSLTKYMNLLDKTHYNIQVINSSSSEFPFDEKMTEDLLFKLSKLDINNISVRKAFELLENMQKDAKSILYWR